MQIKEGAILAGLRLEMRLVLSVADELWHEAGEELVVTAGLDGTHSAGSLHYYGFAVDLRTRYFDRPTIEEIAEELRFALGHNYDVIIHNSHIHVEYQKAIDSGLI